jgi:flagellar biogenesis protein FliO
MLVTWGELAEAWLSVVMVMLCFIAFVLVPAYVIERVFTRRAGLDRLRDLTTAGAEDVRVKHD